MAPPRSPPLTVALERDESESAEMRFCAKGAESHRDAVGRCSDGAGRTFGDCERQWVRSMELAEMTTRTHACSSLISTGTLTIYTELEMILE